MTEPVADAVKRLAQERLVPRRDHTFAVGVAARIRRRRLAITTARVVSVFAVVILCALGLARLRELRYAEILSAPLTHDPLIAGGVVIAGVLAVATLLLSVRE